MYQDTVTVFHKLDTTEGIVWYPYVFPGVTLHRNQAANMEKTGAQSADTVKLHVRYQKVGSKILIGELEFFSPKAWKDEDHSKAITFQQGTDFFLDGEYEEKPVLDDNYRDGFYHFMKSTKDHVFMITSVDGPFKLIPHFEIGGK